MRSLRYKQLGHANMFQNLLNKMKPNSTTPNKDTNNNNNNNNPDPNNKQTKDPNDPNNMDPNNKDSNKQIKQNPLDNFKDLFKIDAEAQKTNTPPAFSLDPEALKKITGQLNFTGQMTPELLEKLKSGDAETVQGVLNSLGQNVYSTMMQHIPALTEQFVNARLEHSQKGLGKSVKQTLTHQALTKLAADNPVLQHQLETVSGFLLEKFPDADPDWIAEQTGKYFVETAKLLSPDSFRSEDEIRQDSTRTQNTRDISQHPDFEWGKYLTNTPANSAKT